jgi:hypothetical protein
VALWQPTRAAAREARFHRARRHFRLRREWLEARFVRAAAQRAQSNVVHWSDCEFDDGVAYVRNRTSGELSAFVEVSVPVEEPYGGRGSGLEPGASRRVGTAIFRFDRNHWQTDGRALLNLNPSEAILYYHEDLEVIGPQSANQAQ